MMHHVSGLVVLLCMVSVVLGAVTFTGVNLSGGEFGSQPSSTSGYYGSMPNDYVFPTNASLDYWLSKDVTIVRLPFYWERLQQSQMAALDTTYLGYIRTVVDKMTASKVNVVLDAHSVNGAWYLGNNLSPSGPSTYADFGDFWSKVANVFKDNPYVWFGLINEPHNIDTKIWVAAANTAIAAIRATGANNRILVCGNSWTGVHSWFSTYMNGINAVDMLNVTDSGNNLVIEVHQYFDGDYSGTNNYCNAWDIATIFQPFTDWARSNGKKAFLGEFGAPDTTQCKTEIQAALDHMAANSDVYLGWTWWVAGYAWSYYNVGPNAGLYSIEPATGTSTDKAQFAWLSPYFAPNNGISGVSGGGSTTTVSGGSSNSASASAGGSTSPAHRLSPPFSLF